MAGRSHVRDFLAGIAMLGRGLRMYGTDTRLLVLGLIPALLAGLLIIGLLGVLIAEIGNLSTAVTWFADHWPHDAREVLRFTAGAGLIGVFLLLTVVTFTSLTLAIGDPFYERISARVEDRIGPDRAYALVELPWWREFARGVRESIRVLGLSALVGVPLFLAGLIPVVGQTAVPVIGASVGGWFLAVELVGVPFARRGLGLADRRRILREHRALAVGFGAATFACFLIPFGAVLVTPAAVAGATMLARRVLAS